MGLTARILVALAALIVLAHIAAGDPGIHHDTEGAR